MNRILWSTSFLTLVLCLWLSKDSSADQQAVLFTSESSETQAANVKTSEESDKAKLPKSVKITGKLSGKTTGLPWKGNPFPLIPLPPEQTKKQPVRAVLNQTTLSWGGKRQQIFSHNGHIVWFEWLNGGHKLLIAEGDRKGETRLSVRNIDNNLILWEKWIPNGVTSLTVSPDGSELAVASSDDQITLINSSDGKSQRSLIGHLGDIRRISYSADGSKLVSLSYDRTAAFWDVSSGDLVIRTRIHEQTPFDIGLLEQGSLVKSTAMRLLICGSNGSLQWWTVGKDQLIPDPIFPHIGIRYPKYPSKDGRYLFTLDKKQNATLFDGQTGKELGALELPVLKTTTPDSGQATDPILALESKPGDKSVNKDAPPLKAEQQSNRINAVVFSPDKSLVAGGTITGQIMIWSTSTRKLLKTLAGHKAPIAMMSFTQDNNRLASSAFDGALILWNVETAAEEKRIFPATESIRPFSLAQKSMISADGRVTVLPRTDGGIDLVDLASRRKNRTLIGPPGRITSLAVNDSGEQVVAGLEDGSLSVWNLKNAASTAVRIKAAKSAISALVIKSKILIAGTTDGKLLAVDLATGKVDTSVNLGTRGVNMISINAAGTVAAVVQGTKQTRLVRIPNFEQLHNLPSPNHPKEQETTIRAIAFAPTGNWLAVGDSRGEVDLWDVTESGSSLKVKKARTVTVPAKAAIRSNRLDSKLINAQPSLLPEIAALQFTLDGQRLLVSAGSLVMAFGCAEATKQSMISTLMPATSLAVRPEDSRLFVLSIAGDIYSWMPTVQLRHQIAAHKGDAKFVLVTPDGKSIISGGTDKKVQIWNPTTGASAKTLTGGIGVVTRGSMTSNGNILATCGYSSAIELWDLPQQTLIAKRYGHGSKVAAVALSPDEKRIASSEEAGPLLIRSLPRFKTEVTIPKQELPVTRIIWMPDGEHILTSTGDWKQWHLQGQVRVWNATTGKQTMQLDGILGQTTCLLLTPDGRFLVTTSYDKILRIWETETWTVRAKVQHDQNIRGITFLNSGRLLACVIFPNSGFILDTQNGEIRNRFVIPTSLVQDVAAAWDANWFVTCGMKGSLQVWHLSGSKSSK